MNEDKFWIMIRFVGGVWLLWQARRAWQAGEVADYSEDSGRKQFSYGKQPDKFIDQWMRLVICGVALIAWGVWLLVQPFHELTSLSR